MEQRTTDQVSAQVSNMKLDLVGLGRSGATAAEMFAKKRGAERSICGDCDRNDESLVDEMTCQALPMILSSCRRPGLGL